MENNKKYSTPTKKTPSKSNASSYNDTYSLLDSYLNDDLDISPEELKDIIKGYFTHRKEPCTKDYK